MFCLRTMSESIKCRKNNHMEIAIMVTRDFMISVCGEIFVYIL